MSSTTKSEHEKGTNKSDLAITGLILLRSPTLPPVARQNLGSTDRLRGRVFFRTPVSFHLKETIRRILPPQVKRGLARNDQATILLEKVKAPASELMNLFELPEGDAERR